MGQVILGVWVGLITGVVLLGFTCWLGIALLAMTVGHPSEMALDLVLVMVLLVALGSGISVGRRVALRR